MKPYMILKSTETIAIEDAFPSRATLLLRRSFTIQDIVYVSGGDAEGDFEDAHLASATWQVPQLN